MTLTDWTALIDVVQTMALLGVMLVLGYLVWLLRLQLRDATGALRLIVRSLDEVKVRLDALEGRKRP